MTKKCSTCNDEELWAVRVSRGYDGSPLEIKLNHRPSPEYLERLKRAYRGRQVSYEQIIVCFQCNREVENGT